MTQAAAAAVSCVPYQGRADHAWPPCEGGWAEVPYHHDAGVRERAVMMLGALPPYHYADEVMGSGLYRFFAFETPIGQAVGALKFIGEAPARALLLGQSPTDAYASTAAWIATPTDTGDIVTDAGAALPANNSAVTGNGSASGGVVVTPVNYGTLAAAAAAMNSALGARGYVRSDQPIYAGFQIKAGGLTVDAFPGTHTMASLRAALPAGTMANVRVYPWLATTPGGATGQAAYDGTNAPTWAQWTGSGTGGAPAMAKAGMGSGALVAGAVTVAVAAAALIAKSAGAF
jgi:hypothetical protein